MCIRDRPTYFVSLKDAAGLVKMYAFVDVEQYQIVGTGQTIDEARRNYREALNLEDAEIALESADEPVSGTIDEIYAVVVSGNTVYYFTLTGDAVSYTHLDVYKRQGSGPRLTGAGGDHGEAGENGL